MGRSLLLLASTLATACAHQNFHQFWVNNVSPGYQTCIRMPPNNNPVTAISSNDITCNVNGNIVPSGVKTCNANAGDTIEVQWDSSTHPGPITHFLYGPVSDASMATGVGSWVKIAEEDYVDGEWANQIMEAVNMTYTFTLPKNLATGDYLLRGEMEALHSSTTIDQTQFYIGCAQLHITGPGGSCGPSIQLPGAYKDTDTNIYIPNFYYGFDPTTFTAPGGPVATCGAGSGGGATASAKPPVSSVKPSTTLSTVKVTTTALPPSSTPQPASSSVKASTSIKTSVAPVSSATSGTVPKYGQCGGTGYSGSTVCAAGSTCTVSSPYYSQCI